LPPLLKQFVQVVDWLSATLGKLAAWAVLLAGLISAGNAFVRYGLDISSNAWLEIQWYLFAATVMMGAPVVLRFNEHVRVDIIYGKLKGYGPVYVDLFGLVFFLLPVMALLTWLTWPFFMNMFESGEVSGSIGGLIRWPAALLMPAGFGMMFAQGVAEIIKRIAYLRGTYQMDTHYEKPLQ
jgi:TRAP-type mannitol/chloroaromatic compound transport system permease small subunit